MFSTAGHTWLLALGIDRALKFPVSGNLLRVEKFYEGTRKETESVE